MRNKIEIFTIFILLSFCWVQDACCKSLNDESFDQNSARREKRGYKFGDFIIKPVIRKVFGSSDNNENEPEMTTNYNYANYAFSPGYYADSIVSCSGDAIRSVDDSIMKITCRRNGMEISCYENLLQHDVVYVECQEGYTYPSHAGISQEIECLPSGRWNYAIYECVANCGRVTKKAAALVIHGSSTEVSEFPWNVAIYRGEILTCGGTIISERVILSAAHCFTTETSRGVQKIPLEEFKIVVGKYFRAENASENNEAQHFRVAKVKIHDTYFGFSGNYDADIAIITLNKPISYKPHIAPACLSLDLKTIAEKQPPPHGTMGSVAGYGYTEADGKPSETLKKISLPIVDVRICKDEAPDSFKQFVTSDKICAGYNDGRGAVCRGDSGAGLVFPQRINGENIYHLHGIVSNTRSVNGGCDLHFYTMFTHVQNYIDQIKEELRLSKSLK